MNNSPQVVDQAVNVFCRGKATVITLPDVAFWSALVLSVSSCSFFKLCSLSSRKLMGGEPGMGYAVGEALAPSYVSVNDS